MVVDCYFGRGNKVVITEEGKKRLEAKRARLRTELLELTQQDQTASRSGGNESLLAYNTCQQQEQLLMAKIVDTDRILQLADIAMPPVNTDRAAVGLVVGVLVDNGDGQGEISQEYFICGHDESDATLEPPAIAYDTPLGRALVGKTVGQTAVAELPRGDVELELVYIRWPRFAPALAPPRTKRLTTSESAC